MPVSNLCGFATLNALTNLGEFCLDVHMHHCQVILLSVNNKITNNGTANNLVSVYG